MKQYFKRSTAGLLCLALLMGLLAGVPGVLITMANAEEATGTATAQEAPSSIVANFDTEGLDWSALQLQGWDTSSEEIGIPTIVEKDGNKVLTAVNTNLTGSKLIYSPYIALGDAEKLYFSAEGMKSSGKIYVFVRYFDADKKAITYKNASDKTTNLQSSANKTSDGEWVTLNFESNFKEMAETYKDSITGTPVYARILLQMEKPSSGVVDFYWDNISLATDHTAHAFTEASDLVKTAGDSDTATVYWGKCACGAVSHVETVEGTATEVVTGAAAIIRGDVTTGYATLAEALAAVQEGDTLKLLADVSDALTLTNMKNVVLDGNGKTITAQVKVSTGIVGLTVKNVTFDSGSLYFYKSASEKVTISNCTFQNNALIKGSSTDGSKDLTISGCTFESYSSDAPTATAIQVRKGTNVTITGNTFKGVQWNAIQLNPASGDIVITDNVINWIATRETADGVFNMAKLSDAKVTIKGNTVTTTNSVSTFPVVYAQYGATNVALYLYDNLSFSYPTEGDAAVEFKNTETAADHTIYCTGHTYDNDDDTTCNVCGAVRQVEEVVTGVAAIIRGDVTTGYATLTEALAALQEGDTLKLLADISEAFTLTNIKNVVLDGNGKTITAQVKVSTGVVGLTVKNVTFDNGKLYFYKSASEKVTVSNCTFQNNAAINSSSGSSNKDLVISGCTFESYSNDAATATAIKVVYGTNVTITGNTFKGVQWNAIQFNPASGDIVITDNVINWIATRETADGVFNMAKLSDAKVTIKGNTVTTTNSVSTFPVVYAQYGATNVVLYLYDNLSFSYPTEGNAATAFEEPVQAADHTIYCSGHTYDNDADTTCNVCGAERSVTPPAPTVTEGTIAQALAAELNSQWKVTGAVTLIEGQNLYIQDETGAICVRLSAAPTDLAIGDNVTVEGTRAEYKKLPQLNVTSCTKVSKTITITPKDVTLPLTAADLCKAVKLSGVTITEIFDDNGKYTNPNITVSDGTNTIQIYKAVAPEGLAVGDKVDVVAVLSCYNDTLQLRNDEATDIVKVVADDDTTGGDDTGNTPDPTGDNTAIVAMTAIMVAAVATLAVLVIGKKRMF